MKVFHDIISIMISPDILLLLLLRTRGFMISSDIMMKYLNDIMRYHHNPPVKVLQKNAIMMIS